MRFPVLSLVFLFAAGAAATPIESQQGTSEATNGDIPWQLSYPGTNSPLPGCIVPHWSGVDDSEEQAWAKCLNDMLSLKNNPGVSNKNLTCNLLACLVTAGKDSGTGGALVVVNQLLPPLCNIALPVIKSANGFAGTLLRSVVSAASLALQAISGFVNDLNF